MARWTIRQTICKLSAIEGEKDEQKSWKSLSKGTEALKLSISQKCVGLRRA